MARKKMCAALSAALCLCLASEIGWSAPLPPLPALDVCGTVRSAYRLPSKTVPAMPGLSGSLGRERTWPARFVVVLAPWPMPSGAPLNQINGLLTTSADGVGVDLGPDHLLLVLPERGSLDLLLAGSICVRGFTVSGDEGGTWTDYDGLTVERWAVRR